MARAKVVVVESGWADFGKFIAILVGVAAIGFLLVNIIVLPYERHKEIINKLDNHEYKSHFYNNK